MTAELNDSPARVLVVEDEESIRDLVSFHLDLSGYHCTSIADGREALRVLSERPFDLVVLDLNLPGLDGLSLCRAIRREGQNQDVPILMLTARREESDKVLGLDSGADDYLTKPFSVREFVARTAAMLRRQRHALRGGARRTIGLLGVTIDPGRRKVVCDGSEVSLTPQEFNLLYLLMSSPGIVFAREELTEKIWGNDVFIDGRGVDTVIKRLRRKIESDPGRPQRLLTARGVGYKFGP
jgi:two-component system OmpR family response regulator/two-component system alkaline phosphatase synthesis response regulator PhoP